MRETTDLLDAAAHQARASQRLLEAAQTSLEAWPYAYWTPDELAACLRVSTATARKELRVLGVPVTRVGRLIRIGKDDALRAFGRQAA